jgi:hypothetical protein
MSSQHETGSVHRRDVVCGGGRALFGLMVTALLGGTKPVRAASASNVVPEIDGLAVRVVVDSYQFAVAPSRKSGNVDIQHFGWGIGAASHRAGRSSANSACRCTSRHGGAPKPRTRW